MFQLLAIVEVPHADRVLCQAAGCKHPVYKRIHVVRKDGELTVLGSECFNKLFGRARIKPLYGSGEGRLLTPEERQLLIENTERLISQFEDEYQAALEKERLIAKERADVEASRRAAEERRLLEAKSGPSFVKPIALPPARNVTPTPPRKQIPTTGDPRYEAVLDQVRQEYRALGLDPDQAGWQGMLKDEVRKRLS